MKCALKVEEEAKYLVEHGVEPYPILPIRIFREEGKIRATIHFRLHIR